MAASRTNNSPAIRFVLDGELHVVDDQQPTLTVLQYLREHLNRMGTKEGCAEGDCGACTVVLAELDGRSNGNGIRYRPVNSCIQFLPTLDGKVLFTVESLKKIAGGSLHPVQQKMVDCHGSQCGFCTPGFVMSLFSLYMTNRSPSAADIRYALSGNLCRCTGYRPILAAAEQMYELDDPSPADFEAELKSALSDIRVDTDKELKKDGFHYVAPCSVASLAKSCAAMPDATILAGGTDVGLWVTKHYKHLQDIIFIGNVADLNQINVTDEFIEIGAAIRLSDAFEALLIEYPDFEEIVRRFASPPICNSGTLGGNVANGSPIGDSMPGLIALGAEVCLQRGDETRCIALGGFYLDYMKVDLQPGEFVCSVRVPRAKANVVFRSYKISKRFDQDISAVCAAFALKIDNGTIASARVCFGGMAETPKRAAACEMALTSTRWDSQAVENAVVALLTDFEPITDMRATGEYRQQVAGNLLRRFFAETSDVCTERGEKDAVSVWDYAEQRA